MNTLTVYLQSRGTGLVDDLPPNALADAARAALVRLPEREQALIEDAARALIAGISARKRHRSSFGIGEAGALELLAALGRVI